MSDPDIDQLLLIVTGASLRAEMADRPLAYALGETIQNELHRRTQSTTWPIRPVVCADVWYVNNRQLHDRPTISIGGPGANALSAYLYEKLPTALAIEDQLVIQLDVAYSTLAVAIWGMDRQHSSSAVELFENKYLGGYLDAVLGAL